MRPVVDRLTTACGLVYQSKPSDLRYSSELQRPRRVFSRLQLFVQLQSLQPFQSPYLSYKEKERRHWLQGLGAVIPRDICETQIPFESELKGLT